MDDNLEKIFDMYLNPLARKDCMLNFLINLKHLDLKKVQYFLDLKYAYGRHFISQHVRMVAPKLK